MDIIRFIINSFISFKTMKVSAIDNDGIICHTFYVANRSKLIDHVYRLYPNDEILINGNNMDITISVFKKNELRVIYKGNYKK